MSCGEPRGARAGLGGPRLRAEPRVSPGARGGGVDAGIQPTLSRRVPARTPRPREPTGQGPTWPTVRPPGRRRRLQGKASALPPHVSAEWPK